MNAVGSCIPTTRELDTETIAGRGASSSTGASRASNEAGDYIIPLRRARSGPTTSGPSSARCSPAAPGREPEDELTVFKSLGIGVEDLASAELVVRRARERGVGAEVPF